MLSRSAKWAWLMLLLLALGCQRGGKLPQQSGVHGLLSYDYAGLKVIQQTSERRALHLRLHLGWQSPVEYDLATQQLAVEAAFTCGAGEYGPQEFARRLEYAGAKIRFEESARGTVVIMEALESGFKDAWGLMALSLSDPMFERQAFVALRSARVARAKAMGSERQYMAAETAYLAAWPEDSTNIAGARDASAYEKVSQQVAEVAFRDLLRHRANLRVVLVTALDPNVFADLLLETVDGIPDGSIQPWIPQVASPQLGNVVVRPAAQGEEALVGIFPAKPAASAEGLAMVLLATVLEQRLYDQLVVHDHVARLAQVRYHGERGGFLQLDLTGANAFRCGEFALSELRKLKANGIGEGELAAAKARLGAEWGLAYEPMSSLARMLDQWSAQDRLVLAGNEAEMVKALTVKRCNKLLGHCLQGVTWSIVGDTSNIDRKSLLRL